MTADDTDTILVVTPHPDDSESSSGGTISRWCAEGKKVILVVCTDGSKGTGDRSIKPEDLAITREAETLEAAKVYGLAGVEFLRMPDQALEDNDEFREKIVRQIRKHKPRVLLTVEPDRPYLRHRDHTMAGRVSLDAVFPYARDHLHFPEHMEHDGISPYKVREVLMWGSDAPNAIVDTTNGVEKQIEALHQHESQVGGLSGGPAVGDRLRERARSVATNYPFEFGQAYRRMIARG